MKKNAFPEEKRLWILTICPCTGEEVVGGRWNKQFSTLAGEVSWWYCPACGGWHVFRPELDEAPSESSSRAGKASSLVGAAS